MKIFFLFLSILITVFSVPCTPPTDNKWGRSQGVLEVAPSLSTEPKCFTGKSCMMGCRTLKCTIWSPEEKRFINKWPAVYFDISFSPELVKARQTGCERAQTKEEINKYAAKRLQADIKELLIKEYQELNYKQKGLSDKEKVSRKRRLEATLFDEKRLMNFFKTAKKTCNKLVNHSKLQIPQEFIAKWKSFVYETKRPKHYNQFIFDKGQQISFFLLISRKKDICHCENLFDAARKNLYQHLDKLKEKKQEKKEKSRRYCKHCRKEDVCKCHEEQEYRRLKKEVIQYENYIHMFIERIKQTRKNRDERCSKIQVTKDCSQINFDYFK